MTARKAKRRGPVKARTGPLNRGQEWTARELRLLERYYGRIPRKELVARYLPERTLKGIEHRAGLLGLTRRRSKPPEPWTDAEIELLKRHHGKMSIAEINARYLPERTPASIEHRARLLGLTTPRAPVYSWKTEDLALLRRYYGTMSNHKLCDRYLPQASIQAIRHKARRLGLRSKEPDWSAEENRLLKRYYGRMTNPELVRRHLPRRTADTVQGRAAKLGLTRQAFDTWTAKELRLLKKRYPTHALPELTRYFPGRTAAAMDKARARTDPKTLRSKGRPGYTGTQTRPYQALDPAAGADARAAAFRLTAYRNRR